MTNIDLRARILLTLQSALIGEVTAGMQAVLVSWTEENISLRILFSSPPSLDEVETASRIETEMISHLPEFSIQIRIEEACGKPTPTVGETFAFLRSSDLA